MSCQKSKVGGGGVIATQPVLFNGKRTKIRFSCISGQIHAKFVLYAIYFDVSLLSHLSQPLSTHFGQKIAKSLDFDDFCYF